jgi:hypothetical protein
VVVAALPVGLCILVCGENDLAGAGLGVGIDGDVEATEQGQSEVWIPVTDPHAAQFVADCENFDRIIFKDLRTIAEQSICELQNIAA